MYVIVTLLTMITNLHLIRPELTESVYIFQFYISNAAVYLKQGQKHRDWYEHLKLWRCLFQTQGYELR